MSSWFCTLSTALLRKCTGAKLIRKKSERAKRFEQDCLIFYLWVVLQRAYVMMPVSHLSEKMSILQGKQIKNDIK